MCQTLVTMLNLPGGCYVEIGPADGRRRSNTARQPTLKYPVLLHPYAGVAAAVVGKL